MKVTTTLFAVAISAIAATVFAQDKPKPKATSEADNINLEGDTLKFNAEIGGFAKSTKGAATTGIVTAPQESCFRVSHEIEKESKKYVRGTFRTGWRFWYSCNDLDASNTEQVQANLSYDIPMENLENTDYTRFGWTYGVLVAPFKYYWSERNFSTGAAVGPYLGYRLYDRPGNSSVIAGAIGATSATVKTQNSDGTSGTAERNGITVALAYLLEIKKEFNVGLIGGWDVFSKSDNIPNSGKFWLSMSIGKKLD